MDALKNYTYKQQHRYSCGAACLMVAAKELGVTNLPNIPDNPFWFGETLKVNTQTENSIYAVTCKNHTGFSEYSMPDGIATAAQNMGLQVSVHMAGCMVPRLLKRMYPAVFTQLTDLTVPVEYGTPSLKSNQRMLVVVGVGGILGLHYVLYRPDKSYMDPAYGENFSSIWKMGQCYIARYVDTGIYIVVTLNDEAQRFL